MSDSFVFKVIKQPGPGGRPVSRGRCDRQFTFRRTNMCMSHTHPNTSHLRGLLALRLHEVHLCRGIGRKALGIRINHDGVSLAQTYPC